VIEKFKNLNMLIVEDGGDIRDIMASTFGKIFNSIQIAVDGQDGLAKFKEKRPDIIITDIRMPNMNGNEMIEAIKELDSTVPIIVVSGHGRRIKATQKADAILEKPIKFDQLLAAIQELIK
jgi:CheY-like chemotaxis protein